MKFVHPLTNLGRNRPIVGLLVKRKDGSKSVPQMRSWGRKLYFPDDVGEEDSLLRLSFEGARASKISRLKGRFIEMGIRSGSIETRF